MIALPRSTRLIAPLMSFRRAPEIVDSCSRSASRIRCRMTCFAVCAPMRPNRWLESSSMKSRAGFGYCLRFGELDLLGGFSTVRRPRPAAPERLEFTGVAVDRHAHVGVLVEALLGREAIAISRAPNTTSCGRSFPGQARHLQQELTAHVPPAS